MRLIPLFVLCLTITVQPAMLADGVKIDIGPSDLTVQVDNHSFTTYHFAATPGQPLIRPYFYPILAADGTQFTSDQEITDPKDHPHHRSMWVGMGSVNGIDHWGFDQKPAPAKQRHIRFESVGADSFVEDLAWEDLHGGDLLTEKRTAHFITYPNSSRAIALTVSLTAAGQDVILGDTKEAGLCAIRVNPQISKHPTLINSQGARGEKAVWGKRAEWVDESGMIDGKPFGVAIFDSPDNPRYPTPWHAREYGLLAPNEFGLHVFDPKLPAAAGNMKIINGHTITFHFLALFHPGDAAAANIQEKYHAFSKQGQFEK